MSIQKSKEADCINNGLRKMRNMELQKRFAILGFYFFLFSFSFEIALANILCWLEILLRAERAKKKVFLFKNVLESIDLPGCPEWPWRRWILWLSLLDAGSEFWKWLGDAANEVARSSWCSIETGSGGSSNGSASQLEAPPLPAATFHPSN